MKIIQIILLGLIIIGLGLIFTQKYWVDPLVNFIIEQNPTKIYENNPFNISFTISGQDYTLINGVAEKEIVPGSTSKEIVRIFGEPVYGDLNGDSIEDAVMFLTQNSGGSGTFFYVVEAINKNGKFKGTNALFLGDRIAPQNINIVEGRAVANFAERKVGENFSVQPSVGRSLWIYLDKRKTKIMEIAE